MIRYAKGALVASLIFVFLFGVSQKVAFAADASFTLSPSKNTYKLNETFTTDIVLSTGGGRVSAADVYFTFDKDKIRLEEIKEGKIFNQYVGREIDNFLGKGAISGVVNSPEQLFNGTGSFVTLKFKTLKAGTASIVFKFTKDSKNDSNVADFDQKTDTLSKVENGLFIIIGEELQTENKIQSIEKNDQTTGSEVNNLGNIPSDNNGSDGDEKNLTGSAGNTDTGIRMENNSENISLGNSPSSANRSLPMIVIGVFGLLLLGAGAFFLYRFKPSRY